MAAAAPSALDRAQERWYLGRPITCTRCRQLIDVVEIPRRHIDPARYVCNPCLRSDT